MQINRRFSNSFLICSVTLSIFAGSLAKAQVISEPRDRITSYIDDGQMVARPGNVHPLARAEYDGGLAPQDLRMERMMLVLAPYAAQQKALAALLSAQLDPRSPQYHQWLTPETFGKLFGVSESDLDQITGWLKKHGFEVEPIPSGRLSVIFSGTAGQVEAAFQSPIHIYNVDGETHYANATDPRIPLALSEVVQGVASLHNFQSQPMHNVVRALTALSPDGVSPDYTGGTTHYMAPADFATIYDVASLYAGVADGTGQSIAVVGRTNINIADVQAFRSGFGLPANSPSIIVNGANPGIVSTNEEMEAVLDVEWAGAVAKNAAIQFVVSASTNTTDGVLLSAQYIVNRNLAPVMTTSFSLCEAALGASGNQVWNALWQQAAAQGISAFVASGDSGAAGCASASASTATGGRAVNGLCSSPYSTCVGGTEFAEATNASLYWSATTNPTTYGSALSYIPETAWNESAGVAGGSGLWSTGGGASQVYAKPTWQSGIGVPADGWRDVPDVALSAAGHDGYLIRMNGGLYVVGGTSAATPSFAGLMGLVVQRQGVRQGNANPTLYGLAANQGNGGAAVFHDVVTGSNSVAGVTGYSAGPGYDLATGLGSVDAGVLVNHWGDVAVPTPGFQLAMSPASLTIQAGTSASATVTLTASGGFNSSVALSVSGLPVGLTGGFSLASIGAGGSNWSNLTLSAGATLAAGTYNLTISGTGGGLTRSALLTVAIAPRCTYSINPTSATLAATGGTYSAAVSAASGCAWSAASNAAWIGVTSGASGSGNGTVYYSAPANSATGARVGTLTIAGNILTITQAGTPPPASFSLLPTSANFASGGGSGSITVSAPSTTSSWTAMSNVNWIVITGAASGSGSRTVTYTVTANASASARTGTMTIAGLLFTVNQAGSSCTYSISIGSVTAATGGYNGSVAVSCAGGCPWTATSNVSWLTVTSGSPGNGSGTVRFFIATNTTNVARTGVLTVAGYNISITEAKP